MPQAKDIRYSNLIEQIRSLKADAKHKYEQSEQWRIRGKNATGSEVGFSQAQQYDCLNEQKQLIQRAENLMNEVIAIYGDGVHNWH